MVANNLPPAYEHVDSDDDSIPPPPPPTGELENFTDHEIEQQPMSMDTQVPAKSVRKWRLLKKEAEHVLVPQEEQPMGEEQYMSPNSNNTNIPMQGHFRGIHSAQQFDEEEAGMDEIEVPSSSVVQRMNKHEVKDAKKKKMCRLGLLAGIAVVVLIAVITGSLAGTSGPGGNNAAKENAQNDGGAGTGTGTGTGGTDNDTDNENDTGDYYPPPVQNVNMDTVAGRYILANPDIPASVKTNLEDPDSPSSQALDWVLNDPANDDYPFADEGVFENEVAQLDFKQRLALATIGKSIDVNPDWMAETDVCEWEGIECTDTVITKIAITDGNFEGSIPAEIVLLPDLLELALFNNLLTGPIPPELAELPNLTGLDLFNNQLTGEIPPGLFTDKLQGLYLSKNELSGPIPETVGGMTRVQQIWLDDNMLTGGIPVGIGDLPNLVELLLSENQLTGGLPAELANAPLLNNLQLDNNPLFTNVDDTSFPAALKEMDALIRLSMRNVGMEGPFPQFEQGVLPNLQKLYLDDNVLTGEIFDSGIQNLVTLVKLTLSNNLGLGGVIPTEIQELKALEILDLSNCSLEGEIPMEIGYAASLTEIYLSGNNLEGVVPGSFVWLTNLEVFVFDDNFNIYGVHPVICKNDPTYRELRGGCGLQDCTCCTDVCDA